MKIKTYHGKIILTKKKKTPNRIETLFIFMLLNPDRNKRHKKDIQTKSTEHKPALPSCVDMMHKTNTRKLI